MAPDTGGSAGKASAGSGSPTRVPEVTLLTWKSSVLRRRPKTFAVGVIASLLFLGVVWISFPGDTTILFLAAVIMGGALSPLYFPATYTFTNKKAYQSVLFSRDGYRWQDFDEYRVFDDSVFLHLRPTDLRMRYLKGLTVYFGPDNREEVLDIVRQRIHPDAGRVLGSAPGPKK